ncbi:hypothetical protein STEG23_034753, partial [Scotinomys teguina]
MKMDDGQGKLQLVEAVICLWIGGLGDTVERIGLSVKRNRVKEEKSASDEGPGKEILSFLVPERKGLMEAYHLHMSILKPSILCTLPNYKPNQYRSAQQKEKESLGIVMVNGE